MCVSAKELGGRVGGGWHSTACPLCMFRGWKRSSCSAGVRFPPSTPAAGGLGHVGLGEQQGLAWRLGGGWSPDYNSQQAQRQRPAAAANQRPRSLPIKDARPPALGLSL